MSVTTPDAEVVFFLHTSGDLVREKWLPPLLRASAKLLQERYAPDLLHDALLIRLPLLRVELRFAVEMPLAKAKALVQREPKSCGALKCFFAEHRTHFVAKQPGSVKMSIRLLKWWRDQQERPISAGSALDFSRFLS